MLLRIRHISRVIANWLFGLNRTHWQAPLHNSDFFSVCFCSPNALHPYFKPRQKHAVRITSLFSSFSHVSLHVAQTRDGGACQYFLSFCPEDGDFSLGSNEQRYKRGSLKKVFYLTGTPPHWIKAIERMVWLNKPIAFFTVTLGFPFSYSCPIWSSPGSVSPIIHRKLETMMLLVDCRNENQSPVMVLIPSFSRDKNTKVKLVLSALKRVSQVQKDTVSGVQPPQNKNINFWIWEITHTHILIN